MYVIGVDIGGMSIKGGLVNEKGEILARFQFPVDYSIGSDKVIKLLGDTINAFIKENAQGKPIIGIGMGVPGLIDSTHGIVDGSANLKWDHVHLVEELSKITNLPVKITNDANAATLGEVKFGVGNKYNDVIMLTLGTGVGGGIVVGGKLIEGHDGKGAELGHATLVYNGIQCGCGRKGCIECYASASALIRQTKEAMEKSKDTVLWDMCEGDINKINGKIPFDAYKQGDKLAIKVVDQYIEYLGESILTYCNIFRPEAIILSGGIAKQGKYLTDKLTQYCSKKDYGYKNAPAVEILTAILGYDSGIIGGACLFL